MLSKDSPFAYVVTIAATGLLTAVLAPFRTQIGLLNEGLLFLLLTLLIASIWGRGPGLFAAVTTNLALNFFFIDPLYRFTVQEPRNTVALGVFLVVSIVGSSLLSAARDAAARARLRQAETEIALALSREMSGEIDPAEALEPAVPRSSARLRCTRRRSAHGLGWPLGRAGACRGRNFGPYAELRGALDSRSRGKQR